MADHCVLCDTKRPAGGTNLLVLNGGKLWLEFCQGCESEEIQNAETGEIVTVKELWDRCKTTKSDAGTTPATPTA